MKDDGDDGDGDGGDVIAFCLLGNKRKFPNGSRVRSKPNKEKDGDVTCFSSNKKIWLRSKIRSKPKKKKGRWWWWCCCCCCKQFCFGNNEVWLGGKT